jgi:hypothetical protein
VRCGDLAHAAQGALDHADQERDDADAQAQPDADAYDMIALMSMLKLAI